MPMRYKHTWELYLDLLLRDLHGVGFQDFFSDVMEAVYDTDFVRLRPYGSDKGCDGYRQKTGDVYACYGALDEGAVEHRNAVRKLNADFTMASNNLFHIMKGWYFVHNFRKGIQVPLIERIEELKKENPYLNIEIHSPIKIIGLVNLLSDCKREKLIGSVPKESDYRDLEFDEVEKVIMALTPHMKTQDASSEKVEPVNQEKLNFNRLSPIIKGVINNARINTPRIREYFRDHTEPNYGERIADIFRKKYSELKSKEIEPDDIFEELWGFASDGSQSVARRGAIDSILSYFFDSCDIFENNTDREK